MLAVGQLVGNYRITRLIGEGGMGLVFQAEHQYIGRQVAIKILRPELARDHQYVTRFLNEARAVNLVKHPGLLEIFEFGLLPDGSPHIIMELLGGESIAARLKHEGGPLAKAPRIGRAIALALAAAHQGGVVHRDLKPHNVFLVPDLERAGEERIKVIDFGIAKMDPAELPPGIGDGAQRTRSGAVLGTPEYMAPEQCQGASRADAKADVYSLGVMLYEMLTGRRPFVSDLPSEIMTLHVRSPPPPITELAPNLPEELAALTHRMLSKRPIDRPTMEQVAERLLSWVDLPATSLVYPGAAAGAAHRTLSSLPSASGGTLQSIPSQSPAAIPGGVRPRSGFTMMLLLVMAVVILSVIALQQWKLASNARQLPRPEASAAAAPAPPASLDSTAAAPRTVRFEQKAEPTPIPTARSELPAPTLPAPTVPAPPASPKAMAPASSSHWRGDGLVVPLFKEKRSHGR